MDIVLIGAGAAGGSHLRAIERIPSLHAVAAIDVNPAVVAPFRGARIPVYSSASQASSIHRPNIVIVATPTPTHAEVYREASKSFTASNFLIEKPAADTLEDARHLIEGMGKGPQVSIALHMGFAPEVSWGKKITDSRAAQLGHAVWIESWAGDPHQQDMDVATATLGDSWIDSGINSLSVIDRFATVISRTSLRKLGEEGWSAFEGTFTCDSGGRQATAAIRTSWRVTDATRSTRIRYSSGAELVMDHHAVAGYLTQNGRITEIFGSDGTVPRRDSHYAALYQWWLVDGNPVASPGTAMRLHDLLLS